MVGQFTARPTAMYIGPLDAIRPIGGEGRCSLQEQVNLRLIAAAAPNKGQQKAITLRCISY